MSNNTTGVVDEYLLPTPVSGVYGSSAVTCLQSRSRTTSTNLQIRARFLGASDRAPAVEPMQPAPLGAPGGEVGRARTLQLPKTALFGLAECRAENGITIGDRVEIGIENGIENGIAVWRHAAVEASHERRHVSARHSPRHSARHSALFQCLGACLAERGPSDLENGNVRVPLCECSQRI